MKLWGFIIAILSTALITISSYFYLIFNLMTFAIITIKTKNPSWENLGYSILALFFIYFIALPLFNLVLLFYKDYTSSNKELIS